MALPIPCSSPASRRCKHTNWDLAINAPLLLRIPGRTDRGVRSQMPTEVRPPPLPSHMRCPSSSILLHPR